MNRSLLTLIATLIFSATALAGDVLEEGFRNPPDEAKSWSYWWWLEGNVTEEAITRDLEEMKKIGFGGAIIFDAGGSSQDGHRKAETGPMYASPEWTRLFTHATVEARRLGLSLSLNIQSGWNLGGPFVTAEHAAKRLVHTVTHIEGGKPVDIALPRPKTIQDYFHDVAVIAFPNVSQDAGDTFTIHASSCQNEFSIQRAVDGAGETFWVSAGRVAGEGPTPEKNEWLELRFEHPVEIDRLVLAPRVNYGPKDCRLIIDGAETPVAEFVCPRDRAAMVTFPKQTGKTFRLAISSSFDTAPGKPRNVQIAEISLFSGNRSITPPQRTVGKLAYFQHKISLHEFGGSAPDCRPLLADEPDQPGDMAVPLTEVLDLSDKLGEDGHLRWDAPPGRWTVIRFGYAPTGAKVSTSSGQWQGLVLDYLSTEALDFYWDAAVEPLLAAAGDACGKSLRYLHTDSWEAGGMNWSPAFRETFRTRRGYDPARYLPVVAGYIVDDRATSNRFLNDFRRTIGDMIAENHYLRMQAQAADYDIGIHPESGGPHGAPIDSLELLGISDIPMSEFWSWSPRHRVGDANRFFTKQPASAAHTNGRKIVAAEGFTNIGMHWQESFSHNLKPAFDQAVCEGLNLLVWHTVTCSPDEAGTPGQEYFAGTHFNRHNFTWQKSPAFLAYINRVQFLMQQGLPVADVLEYYGENVPNFTQGKGTNTARSLPGYDYDVASQAVLLNQVAGVRDGRVVLKDGMSYRVLALPQRNCISRAALAKVESLVRAGATVLGPKPERTTGLDDAAFSAEIWDADGGIPDMSPHDYLQQAGVAYDFQRVRGTSEKPRIDWIHRIVYNNQAVSLRQFREFSPRDVKTVPADLASGVAADIYYVANLSDMADATVCAFRVTGRQPELWDPLTGEVRDAAAFTQTETATLVPLEFAPYGSIFVVFRREITRDVQGTAETNADSFAQTAELSQPWRVQFDPAYGGPQEPVEFATLESWSKHPDPAIRHYSGIAVYSQEIELERAPGERVFLELGNVCELADVRVNGQPCGSIWAAPFRLDITQHLKPGKNRVEIEVANHWANRIIGDLALPESERRTRTNIQRLTPQTPLVDSGVIGPARLLIKKITPSPANF